MNTLFILSLAFIFLALISSHTKVERFIPHTITVMSPYTDPYYSPFDYMYPWDNLTHRRDMIYDLRGYPHIIPPVEYTWNNPENIIIL